MRTRRLGNTDLELTTVGLGTWAIGGSWQFGWGHQDDSDSIAAITEAIDCGINWLDTAPIYGCGDSETVIGRILKEISTKPIIATKCGLRWNEKREKYSCLKNDSVIEECENSLKRLGVEVIDQEIRRPYGGPRNHHAHQYIQNCLFHHAHSKGGFLPQVEQASRLSLSQSGGTPDLLLAQNLWVQTLTCNFPNSLPFAILWRLKIEN